MLAWTLGYKSKFQSDLVFYLLIQGISTAPGPSRAHLIIYSIDSGNPGRLVTSTLESTASDTRRLGKDRPGDNGGDLYGKTNYWDFP